MGFVIMLHFRLSQNYLSGKVSYSLVFRLNTWYQNTSPAYRVYYVFADTSSFGGDGTD